MALLDDEVVAAAHNPRDLAAKLHEMGPDVAKGSLDRYAVTFNKYYEYFVLQAPDDAVGAQDW